MDIKDIITRINKLDNKEKLHVLNILKTHNVDFTKNTNGYFFNLTIIEEEIVLKISKCLELIETNRDLIRKIDKRREELLEYYKKIIQEKIDNKIKKKIEEYNKKLLLQEIETCIIMNVNNISKIKSNNKIEDPDEMIKEYNKSLCKYEKDSVYANVMAKIKAYNTNNKNKDRKSNDRNDNYEDIEDGDYIMMGIDDMDDDIIDDDIIDDDIINDDIIDDDIIDDDISHGSHMEDEYVMQYSDEIEDDVSNEIENEDENDEDDEETKNDTDIEKNINFYKNLLNKKGYSFDDNKRCFLGFQEYIT